MTGYFEIYYDLPHLEAFLKAGGTQYNSQSLKNEIDDFLREAVLYHIEEKKFDIMGTLTDYLENEELFEGSRDIFRRMPTISSDIFFDTDLFDLVECSHYLAEKLLDWKKSGKHSEQNCSGRRRMSCLRRRKNLKIKPMTKEGPLSFSILTGC